MSDETPKCLVCEKSSAEVPLLALHYQEQLYYICPEHFPLLIHQPHKLVGRLPGADKFTAHKHGDDE